MYYNLRLNNFISIPKRKRYKLFSLFSVGLHIFGALFVIYSLMFDYDNWLDYMLYSRRLVGLEDHKHQVLTVLNVWMIAVQIRYVITDSFIFYNMFRSKLLLKYTIINHGIESILCSIVFLLHNSKDCFIFGVICMFWTSLWYFSYKILSDGSNARNLN